MVHVAGHHAGHADLQLEDIRVDPAVPRADDLAGCEVGTQESVEGPHELHGVGFRSFAAGVDVHAVDDVDIEGMAVPVPGHPARVTDAPRVAADHRGDVEHEA